MALQEGEENTMRITQGRGKTSKRRGGDESHQNKKNRVLNWKGNGGEFTTGLPPKKRGKGRQKKGI